MQIEFGLLAERVTPARNSIRERMFGDMPTEDVDRLLNSLGGGLAPGDDGDELLDDEEEYDYEPEPFEPRHSPTVIAQSPERQAEIARKAKNKRKMAKQSRKQNRKKKK